MKRKHRYIIYKLNDDHSEIILDKVGARDSTFDAMKEDIPKSSSR